MAGLHPVIQVLKQQSSPRSSYYYHHVWLEVWCAFSELLCYFSNKGNGTRTFQKVPLLSRQSTEYFPKSLQDHQDVFLPNVRRAFVFFFVSSGFSLGTLPWMPFLPCLLLIVKSWTLTLTEVSEACSALEVVRDELSMHTWSNFGRLAEGTPLFHVFSIFG